MISKISCFVKLKILHILVGSVMEADNLQQKQIEGKKGSRPKEKQINVETIIRNREFQEDANWSVRQMFEFKAFAKELIKILFL